MGRVGEQAEAGVGGENHLIPCPRSACPYRAGAAELEAELRSGIGAGLGAAALGVGPHGAALSIPGILLMCPPENRRAGREGSCIRNARLLQLTSQQAEQTARGAGSLPGLLLGAQ